MKWEVVFRIKDSIRGWSDQTIDTSYDGVAVHIEIKDLECRMELEGGEKSSRDILFNVGTAVPL